MMVRLRSFMVLAAVILVLMAACVTTEVKPPAGGAARPGPRAALEHLAAAVPAGSVVALTGFKRLGTRTDTLAAEVRDRLEPMALAACRSRGLQMVERDDLNMILEEWKLSQSGLAGGDLGASELLGAGVAFTGEVAHEGQEVHIIFKAVNLATGEILASAQAWQPDSLYRFALVTAAAGPANRGTSDDGRISLAADAATYRVGDHLRLSFKVARPGYVTVLDINPSGEKSLLFPNSYQPDAVCRPGREYHIPPPDGAFDLEVTPPAGIDRVMAVFSSRPGLGQRIKATPVAGLTRAIVADGGSRAVIRVRITR